MKPLAGYKTLHEFGSLAAIFLGRSLISSVGRLAMLLGGHGGSQTIAVSYFHMACIGVLFR